MLLAALHNAAAQRVVGQIEPLDLQAQLFLGQPADDHLVHGGDGGVSGGGKYQLLDGRGGGRDDGHWRAHAGAQGREEYAKSNQRA